MSRWAVAVLAVAAVPAVAHAEPDDSPDPAPEPAAAPAPAPAVVDDDAQTAPAYTTIVVGSRAEISEPELPLPVSVVESEPIAGPDQGTSLAELLHAVPGVVARNRTNFAQDLRLSVRGFGARAAFGIRGVAVVLDGIPLTMADGQAQVDVVDPDLLERVEVLRGPAGALYGNGAGGVVYLESAGGDTRPGADAAIELGAYETRKLMARAADRAGDAAWAIAVTRLDSDGYRARARVEQTLVHGNATWDVTPALELRAVGSYVDAPVAQDSGGLTLDELRADPSAAAPNNVMFATGEAVRQSQVGSSLRWRATAHDTVDASVYHVGRHYEGSIPFRILELDRDAVGGSAQFRSTRRIAAIPSRWTLAVEAQDMRDDRASFANEAGEAVGAAELRQGENVRALGAYGQLHVTPLPWLGVLAGARYDRLRFELDDRLTSDGDQSGTRSFDPIAAMAGVIAAVRDELDVYANVAQAVETPTVTELALRPEGGAGLDADLDPQRATSFELGARGQRRQLRGELALFRIELRDELVPFEDETGRTFYRNAGRSHRTGVEAAAGAALPGGVRVRVAYTWLRARFAAFELAGVDLAGNEVPGIAPHQLAATAAWGGERGAYVTGDAEYLHGAFADDANTERADDYVLLDLAAGYRGTRGPLRYEVHVGVANLLDEVYVDNLRINAVAGRYYEPGLPRRIYAGATIGWDSGD